MTSLRNFYGLTSVRIEKTEAPEKFILYLYSGGTIHGAQYFFKNDNQESNNIPTYFGENSGIGLAIKSFPRQSNLRIGVAGLGVGTIANYGKKGDYIRFYEINPQIKEVAEKYFTYLKNSKAEIDIIMGDARLSMEKEDPQKFDILVLDAFNSDSIPVHLLTKEAIEIYLKHLKEDGVIVFQITNTYVDLEPVLFKLAEYYGLDSLSIASDGNKFNTYRNKYILMTRNQKFIDSKNIKEAIGEIIDRELDFKVWTDDYSNILQTLKKKDFKFF